MYNLGFTIRLFIFKAFLRAGDALGPLCSIWEHPDAEEKIL